MGLRKYTAGEGKLEPVSEEKQQKLAAKVAEGKTLEQADAEVEREEK